MAKNLLDAGLEVLVHDVFAEAVVDLRELGAGTAATPSEVASKTSTIVTMLPSRYVLYKDSSIIQGCNPGGVLNKVLYREAPPRVSNPYPFIYHF